MATGIPVSRHSSLDKYQQAVPPGIEFIDANTVHKSGDVFQVERGVEAMRFVQDNT